MKINENLTVYIKQLFNDLIRISEIILILGGKVQTYQIRSLGGVSPTISGVGQL